VSTSRIVDLHTHTTASDGLVSPEALVARAREKGLAAVAVTDHDTVAALRAASEAGRAQGVEVLWGVEISCVHSGREVHVLGYLLERPTVVDEAVRRLQTGREERMRAMIERANDLGLSVTYAEVAALAGGESLGRPHLARALARLGYVRSEEEAFGRYLADDRPLNVPKTRLSIDEAVKTVRRAGGLPVLAHPGLHKLDDMLDELVDAGIAGLEAYYPMHTSAQTERYLAYARKRNLAVTGGSDFHGDGLPDRELGGVRVPYACVEALRDRRAGKDASWP